METAETVSPREGELTLERFCRALALHALLVGHPHELRKKTAGEFTSATASLITNYALGGELPEPTPYDQET